MCAILCTYMYLRLYVHVLTTNPVKLSLTVVRSSYNDYSATYNTHTSLLRRHHGEEYELRCTCPVPPSSQPHGKVSAAHAHTAASAAEAAASRDHQQAHTMTIRRSPHVPRHYSLKKTVEVEGNDYEHIWQTPLPNPRAHAQPASAAHAQQPGSDNSTAAVRQQPTNNNNNNQADSKSYQNSSADSPQRRKSTPTTTNSLASTTSDSIASASSSRTSSLKTTTTKLTNNKDASKDVRRPYYVTSKDILLNGPKEHYGAVTSPDNITPCFQDKETKSPNRV